MMSGYNFVRRVHDLEQQLHDLGMRWGHSSWDSRGQFGDSVGVYPRDDQLPQYARDAELFTGSIDDVRVWLMGIQWARQYDEIMGVSDVKQRQRREQDLRNHQLVDVLRKPVDQK
jgi:hypothetical protein